MKTISNSKNSLLLILFAVFGSCQLKSDSDSKISNEVVLIFQHCPPHINVTNLQQGGRLMSGSDVKYMDDMMIRTEVALRKKPDVDTIKVYTSSGVLELAHMFNVRESATYLFLGGDTVLFTYRENIPHVSIMNRDIPFIESNFDIFVREKVRNNKLSAITYYFTPPLLRKLWGFENEKIQTREQERDAIVEEWRLESGIIDSLQNRLFADYRSNILTSRIHSIIMQDSTFLQYSEVEKMLADAPLFSAKNDSLLLFAYYRNYLSSKIHRHTKDIEPIGVDLNGGGKQFPNHFAHFDTISNLDFLSAKARRFFLMDKLIGIFDVGSRDEIKKYIEKYISITGDAFFVNKLLENNNMNFRNSDELLLTDRNDDSTNFQEVLERNKENVVYVTFWASWCAPCRASMPDAKLLREEYKDKDVLFVYLAFNDEEARWKAAKQELELNNLAESYFITNSRTAQMITDLNVSSIPRYFLFNKKGELVHRNAPGPQGVEIREQLNSLLKEN